MLQTYIEKTLQTDRKTKNLGGRKMLQTDRQRKKMYWVEKMLQTDRQRKNVGGIDVCLLDIFSLSEIWS